MTADDAATYVTVEVAGQLFGIAIGRVREVFALERLTHVPLAAQDVVGVLNLRGRIVTAIDIRLRLGLPVRPFDDKTMAVGLDYKNEAFALIVDGVGDVMALTASDLVPPPATLDARWLNIVAGVHRLDGRLMLVLDVDRALETVALALAA